MIIARQTDRIWCSNHRAAHPLAHQSLNARQRARPTSCLTTRGYNRNNQDGDDVVKSINQAAMSGGPQMMRGCWPKQAVDSSNTA